jgi:hypothetical protein
LTGDHCQSKGCDQNIVYDSYYGCTKINFGKQLVVKKSDGTDCGVCALQTFGCGEGLTQKDASGIYAYKKCEPNTDTTAGAPKGCWGPSSACAKGNADGCDQVCANASETKTWSKDALANAKTKTVPFTAAACPKTLCSSGGAILVLDNSFAAQACNYKTSTDVMQAGCSKCHKDSKTNEAVCDQTSKSTAGGNKCDDDATLCGNVCYSKSNFQDCVNGEVICSDTQSYGGISDSSKSYFPANICKVDRSGTMKLVPVISDDGKTGYCTYFNTGTCANQTICANGRCVAPLATLDTTKLSQKLTPQQAANEIYKQIYGDAPTDMETMSERLDKINAAIKPYIKNGVFDLTAFAKANLNLADVQKLTAQDSTEIPGYYDPKAIDPLTGKPGAIVKVADSYKSGYLVDRATKEKLAGDNIIERTYDGTVTTDTTVNIVCDAKGLEDLNNAIDLMDQAGIKNVKFNESSDYSATTYVCLNYARDTAKMLRGKGIDAYTAVVNGSSDNKPNDVSHAVVAIKVGVVKYPNGDTVPTFALIEPQATDDQVYVMGQVGANGTQITNAYNVTDNYMNFDPFRIDDVVVLNNYEISSGTINTIVATSKAQVYTFTLNAAQVKLDSYVGTAEGDDLIAVQIVEDTCEKDRLAQIEDLKNSKGLSQAEAQGMVSACPQ